MKLILSNIFSPFAFVCLYSYLGSTLSNIVIYLKSIGEIPDLLSQPFFVGLIALFFVLPLALFMIFAHLVIAAAFFIAPFFVSPLNSYINNEMNVTAVVTCITLTLLLCFSASYSGANLPDLTFLIVGKGPSIESHASSFFVTVTIVSCSFMYMRIRREE